jgi:hypothetical protein
MLPKIRGGVREYLKKLGILLEQKLLGLWVKIRVKAKSEGNNSRRMEK